MLPTPKIGIGVLYGIIICQIWGMRISSANFLLVELESEEESTTMSNETPYTPYMPGNLHNNILMWHNFILSTLQLYILMITSILIKQGHFAAKPIVYIAMPNVQE